ncbi:Enhances distal genes transcription elongation in a specialized subset of operons that encode extracytoplasmic components [Vibrio sp. B1REV9]|uniref:transcription/translation regulatory transformer protein RfaH n=1 Tax=Vibrio sp. B1REV9 TaxID=2751179 RepID=UPI001B0BEA11|nr:transcription/translation regulatory transformer protein RfaH [Vibrio sp. B1REV9]CAE6952621.1 Enhances distal genes transcription elongation in a specialized subset of operons that encode extracytoplasmic components [Vibrio sp. B1REV9]
MKRWYLLYCKRGEQIRAKQHLENQGVECFYPTVDVEKILRGKRQKVEEPLFPCYIFARFDYEQGLSFTTVRSTRGVVDFVRFGAQPKEIQGDLIYELRLLDKCTDEHASSESIPQPGDEIRVKSGQFAGIDAIFQEQDGEKRSIMLVQMITKRVPVSIDNSDLDLK